MITFMMFIFKISLARTFGVQTGRVVRVLNSKYFRKFNRNLTGDSNDYGIFIRNLRYSIY